MAYNEMFRIQHEYYSDQKVIPSVCFDMEDGTVYPTNPDQQPALDALEAHWSPLIANAQLRLEQAKERLASVS